MIFIFVDETSDDKFKDYFGLCCTAVNQTYYPEIKREFQSLLQSGGWNLDVEFKGSYIFSSTKGCTEVDIEKRVEITEKLLELVSSKKNSRMKLSYFRMKSENQKNDYLEYLPILVWNILGEYGYSGKGGKNLVTLFCDNRSDITIQEIRKAVLPAIESRKYIMVEDVIQVNSNCETIGVLISDIIGYLMSRVEVVVNDSELFENLTSDQIENNGKIKKMRTSFQLIDKLKKMTIYNVKENKGAQHVAAGDLAKAPSANI
jgi:hypothetical protein